MRTLTLVPGVKGFKVSIKQPSGPRSAVRALINVSDFGSKTSALAVNVWRRWLRRRSFSRVSGMAKGFVARLLQIDCACGRLETMEPSYYFAVTGLRAEPQEEPRGRGNRRDDLVTADED